MGVATDDGIHHICQHGHTARTPFRERVDVGTGLDGVTERQFCEESHAAARTGFYQASRWARPVPAPDDTSAARHDRSPVKTRLSQPDTNTGCWQRSTHDRQT
jgi:hypothetical protein